MNFLKRQSGSCEPVNGEYKNLSDFIKKIFMCVPKMDESLMDMERHESNDRIFLLWVNYSLNTSKMLDGHPTKTFQKQIPWIKFFGYILRPY